VVQFGPVRFQKIEHMKNWTGTEMNRSEWQETLMEIPWLLVLTRWTMACLFLVKVSRFYSEYKLWKGGEDTQVDSGNLGFVGLEG